MKLEIRVKSKEITAKETSFVVQRGDIVCYRPCRPNGSVLSTPRVRRFMCCSLPFSSTRHLWPACYRFWRMICPAGGSLKRPRTEDEANWRRIRTVTPLEGAVPRPFSDNIFHLERFLFFFFLTCFPTIIPLIRPAYTTIYQLTDPTR